MNVDELRLKAIYAPLEGEHELDATDWIVSGAPEIGGVLDVPAGLLTGPVAVTVDGAIVAAVARSEDFEPFSVVVRADLLETDWRGTASLRITGSCGLTLRMETNPARSYPFEKPETDFLIVEGRSGTLVRVA